MATSTEAVEELEGLALEVSNGVDAKCVKALLIPRRRGADLVHQPNGIISEVGSRAHVGDLAKKFSNVSGHLNEILGAVNLVHDVLPNLLVRVGVLSAQVVGVTGSLEVLRALGNTAGGISDVDGVDLSVTAAHERHDGGDTGNVGVKVQEAILLTVEDVGLDNDSTRELLGDLDVTLSLGASELGLGLGVGIGAGDVHEVLAVLLTSNPGNHGSSINVDVAEAAVNDAGDNVLSLVVLAHQVDDGIAATDGVADGLLVLGANVRGHKLTVVSAYLEVAPGHVIAAGSDDEVVAGAGELVHNIGTEESSGAKNSNVLATTGVPATSALGKTIVQVHARNGV